MYCKASLVCIWLFWSVNRKQKKKKIITSIVILTVTSPVVINVPTRDLLVIETKGSFVLRWANLNDKTNCSSMFVNSEYSYYAVLQWQTPLRFFAAIVLFSSVCTETYLFVCFVSVRLSKRRTKSCHGWYLAHVIPRDTSCICDWFTSGCTLGE